MVKEYAGSKALQISCYHCGEDCPNNTIRFEDKSFCCSGCQSVYLLLQETGLCTYYSLNQHAGINRREETRKDKFAFLESATIQQALIQFRDTAETHITFYIPYIHCSSCMYLLEQLHRIHKGVIRTDINFLKKEASIIFKEAELSLRGLVELLTSLGYEPHISLQQMQKSKPKVAKSLIYKLGVAGFCFGNIMLLSFPEYFSEDVQQEQYLGNIFRYLSLLLSLPVFFYCASVFLQSAWKGIRYKQVNIDFPVAIAIIATFSRSLIDVLMNNGSGYFDSLSGIVFFMLAGRVLQDKTYGALSFERDYTDYFPIAASLVKDGHIVACPLPDIKAGNTLKIHNNELIPADGILTKGKAQIDYSFVTGESVPVIREMGEMIYAGGKQLGSDMEILVVKEVAHSYLTSLWNKEHQGEDQETKAHEAKSFVHALATNFTWIVLGIALVAGIYWYYHEPAKIWPAVTTILIIACPCALLLTATFTRGYILRILGKNGLFLRNAHVIEPLGNLTHLVFDKTGTLTASAQITAAHFGAGLSQEEENIIASITHPTSHAMSRPVRAILKHTELYEVFDFKEHAGLGVSGLVKGKHVQIGTAGFMQRAADELPQKGTILFIKIGGADKGYFVLTQGIRSGIPELLQQLQHLSQISLLSGDMPHQETMFRKIVGDGPKLYFQQQPADKLNYVKALQDQGQVVGMIGDGLNDAGALKQSNVGICIAEDTNSFTPAGDAILKGDQLHILHKLIRLCKSSKGIIILCFSFSFLYNAVGLFLAVQAKLSPIAAAILMPCSTLSIMLLTYIISNMRSKQLGLKWRTQEHDKSHVLQ
ncbi:heavy metal translocating P-type ATPase [Taibaiella sp. KBW10]|uniref:heavy metal translocating P-type ATPase n=1 Tax=Taibaiella sp. KBW10 TaxID=2153357 RepID=UPI000F5B23B5|nr:heavy metal translocating P-type ATPase metal-binding domain-containing protein [Taibaiella sp. KBW10]RQO30066.1 heavy metal translocating P-type ATPase [Taibaiella sp. KBW10]